LKPKPIRWKLLLLEFALVTKDNNLSRLTSCEITSKEEEIMETFPNEKLLTIKENP